MVRRIHDHSNTEDGRITDCDCPNPCAPAPNWAPADRPPPTSYRDQHERFHPVPGSEGYAVHLGDCLSCWRGFR